MIAEVRRGIPAYDQLLRPLRTHQALIKEMLTDGGHELEESDRKTWWFNIVAGLAVAWCAAEPVSRETDGRTILRCTDNYHRRGYRDSNFYKQVFLARHEAIHRVPAITYLHEGPVVDLHQQHGWKLTGVGGPRPGFDDQRWVELTYEPTPAHHRGGIHRLAATA